MVENKLLVLKVYFQHLFCETEIKMLLLDLILGFNEMMYVKDSCLVCHYSINLSLGVDLLKKKKVLVNMGYGVFARVELLLDTLPRGGALLGDDCHDCHCQPGLSGKIYFLAVFDLVNSIKMQRQISL